jgi:hypothetical protein
MSFERPDNPMTPHVDRTRFVVQEPPAFLTLYFCPACAKQVSGAYDLEPARTKCTLRIHLAEPVAARYHLVATGDEQIAALDDVTPTADEERVLNG